MGISNLAGLFLFKIVVGEDPHIEGPSPIIFCLNGFKGGEILDLGDRDDDVKNDLCCDGEKTGEFDTTTDIF